MPGFGPFRPWPAQAGLFPPSEQQAEPRLSPGFHDPTQRLADPLRSLVDGNRWRSARRALSRSRSFAAHRARMSGVRQLPDSGRNALMTCSRAQFTVRRAGYDQIYLKRANPTLTKSHARRAPWREYRQRRPLWLCGGIPKTSSASGCPARPFNRSLTVSRGRAGAGAHDTRF